jgi:hypothetical protein
VVLAEVGAGVERHALVQVRVAEARRVALDRDARRLELAGVEGEFAQQRLLRQDVERCLALDLARAEAHVELELLLQQLEGIARRGIGRGGGGLDGRRHGGRRDPRVAAGEAEPRQCDRGRARRGSAAASVLAARRH